MVEELALNGSMRAPSLEFDNLGLNGPSFRISALDLNTNLAKFSNFEADISLVETSFFGNYKFEAIANDLLLPAFGVAKKVSLDGTVNFKNAWISNTTINVDNLLVNINSDIKIDTLEGKISNYQIVGEKSNEAFPFFLTLENVEIIPEQLTAPLVEINGSLGKTINMIEVTGPQIIGGLDRSISQNFRLLIDGESLLDKSWRNIHVQAEGLAFSNQNFISEGAYIQEIRAHLAQLSNQQTNAKIEAQFGTLNIISNSQFVADISGGSVLGDIDVLKVGSQSEVNTTLVFKSDSSPVVNLSGDATFSYSETNPYNCLTNTCNIQNLILDYKLVADDATLNGSLTCGRDEDCDFSNMSYVIETNDTASLFENLAKAKILNPFVSALLYRQIASGQRFDEGHRNEYNAEE